MVDKCVTVLSTIGQQVFGEAVVAGNLEELESRLARLEKTVYGERAEAVAPPRRHLHAPGFPPPPVVAEQRPAPRPRLAEPVEREPVTGQQLEDLVGGRLLAWLGGFGVVLRDVFLFLPAVSRRWFARDRA